MSVSHYANSAHTLLEADLEKIAPETWAKFMKVLEELEVSVETFCRSHRYNEPISDVTEQQDEEIAQAWTVFCDEFHGVTRFEIEPAFHDREEEGESGDDINGVFFMLDGVTAITPAGERFNEVVKFSQWVTFG